MSIFVPSPRPARGRDNARGVALVIVLAFVALLTGVLIAFLSRSISDRQISNNSANDTRTRLFAEGAVDTLVSDLKQEIADPANSNVTQVGTAPNVATIYVPKVPANAVPALVGTNAAAGTENLVKRSVRGQPFYPGSNNQRAAEVSSLAPSINGRFISPARWNKPLLLAKATPTSDTDLTPVGATATTWTNAPDWVLVTRDGSVPTTWNANLIAGPNKATAAVGRYAYHVYDEGGLLDVNAVGVPSTAPPANSPQANLVAYKGSLAFADLKQLPAVAALTASRRDDLLNALVGWRNYASAQPTNNFPGYAFSPTQAATYLAFAGNHPKGFLAAGNTALYNGQSDRIFAGRQELLKFLLGGFASPGSSGTAKTERANLQNALQQLTTFSRDLNQPSFAPDPTRPKVLATSSGGNNAGGLTPALDDQINPSFLTVRVKTAFPRNDGSLAVAAPVPEPLVKKRFALNRLAWLTHEGPSATASSATKTALLNAGVSQTLIDQGTPANVYRYFGLSWVSDSRPTPLGDGQKKWVYNHGNSNTQGPFTGVPSAGGSILRVGRPPSVTTPDATRFVQDLTPGREPDFFELLKAGITLGALGKSSSTVDPDPTGATNPSAHWQYQRDIDVDAHIMQVGANLMDQADVDGFPTRIVFNNGAGGLEFRGVENLPYLYRVRYGYFKVRMSVPDTSWWYSGINIASGSGRWVAPGGVSSDDYKNAGGNTMTDAPNAAGTAAANPHVNPSQLTETGLAYQFAIPEIWNPHDQNSSRGAMDSGGNPLYPTSFRTVAQTAPPGGQPSQFNTIAGGPGLGNVQASNNKVDTSLPFKLYTDGSNGWAAHSRALKYSNTGVYFTVDKGPNGFFREPTPLFKISVPAGGFTISGKDPTGNGEDNALIKPDKAGNDDGNLENFASGSGASDGILADPNMAKGFGYNPNKEPVANGKYLGFYFGGIPLAAKVTAFANDKDNNTKREWATTRQFASSTPHLTYAMQCLVNGQWVTYDEKYTDFGIGNMFNQWVQDGSSFPFGAMPGIPSHQSNSYRRWLDPRTSRFGGITEDRAPPFNYSNNYPACLAPGSVTAPIPWPTGVALGVLDQSNWVLTPARPDFEGGRGFGWPGGSFFSSAGGWYPNTGSFRPDLFSQNRPDVFDDGRAVASDTGNPPNPLAGQYYTDADGVVRRGMAAYALPTTNRPAASPPTGVPQALGGTITGGTETPNSQSQSRPFILNRPFRSVTELGYTFSDTPWKNVDFNTPESGFAPLLDVFCISDADNSEGLTAGKVNLNTRQAPVLQAILSGGYKDETSSFTPAPVGYTPLAPLTVTDAKNVADALVLRTTVGSTTKSNTPGAPLTNVASLIGQWSGSKPVTSSASPPVTASSGIDGNKSFDGLSKDLDTVTFSSGGTSSTSIARFREAALRPLANAGQTRVWNLMIDVVAQTGRYPVNASSLANFVVEGEQRYWVHLAIDRYSGQVIDRQIEPVKE